MAERISESEFIQIRQLNCHVRHWGNRTQPTIFLLHGWMDTSATFQFVVDAFRNEWHVIAPDWRGHGQSEWLGRPYWFPDYYADLDALLTHYSPHDPVTLIGHSMGANIASTYAGLRPERVSKLVMLDFLGLKPPPDETAAEVLSRWLEAQARAPDVRTYTNHHRLAERLMAVNPRLLPERANFLAQATSIADDGGRVRIACDPWHKVARPTPYRVEDSMSIWKKIVAPVLMLISGQGFVRQRFGKESLEFQRRTACFRNLLKIDIPDSGHNVQHDQPELTARHIEDFLATKIHPCANDVDR